MAADKLATSTRFTFSIAPHATLYTAGVIPTVRRFGKIIVESRVCDNYDEGGLAKIKIKNNKFAYIDNKTTYQGANMNIYVKNGRIEKAVTYEENAMYDCDLDDFMNITKNKEYKYKYPRTPEGEAKAMEAIKKAKESAEPIEEDVNITETTTKLFDILDVGTYKDKDGKLHLAWVDVDDAYLDKAYLSSIDKKTEVTLRLGYGCDLYADPDCFSKVTVTGSAEQEDGLFMMNLANAKSKERGTIYIPHSYFVQCSDSINCIHMQCKIKTKATQIYNLISLNKNLTEATLRIEDSPNIQHVLILIDGNPNLTEANITS